MNYPIAIELGTDATAFGVVVPDLPGCFSAGDTLDEAITNAKEAIDLWLEVTIDDGEAVPSPSTLTLLQANLEYKGWVWAIVSVDLASLSDKVERVNITLPARILRRIDAASKLCGETRSGYIAKCALSQTMAAHAH